MNKDSFIETANRALDGELTEQELAEFDEAIKKKPALIEIQKEIKSADNLLREFGTVEPPPALRQNVLLSIQKLHAPRGTHKGWFRSVVSSISHRIEIQPSAGIGLGFAMGLLLVVTVSTMTNIPWKLVNSSEAVGTIGNHQINNINNVAVSKELDFSVDGKIAGSVEYSWSDDLVMLNVTVESPKAVTILLEFDREKLEMTAFERIAGSVTDLAYGKGMMSFNLAGTGNYKLDFQRLFAKVTDLKLSVSQEGEILNQAVIELR